MGIVTDYLIDVILRQVDDHGLVVWYDPDQHYADVAHSLSLPDTHVECYDGSFFALRYAVDDLLDGLDAPRLVVYVPLDPVDTHHALIELEAAGSSCAPATAAHA